MAAHQAPPSLGFSRQERWSGLPFPSPMHESGKWKWSRSVVSDSSRPHGLQPTRLLRPWDFPGKSTGVGRHCLLRHEALVLYQTQESDDILYCQRGCRSYPVLTIFSNPHSLVCMPMRCSSMRFHPTYDSCNHHQDIDLLHHRIPLSCLFVFAPPPPCPMQPCPWQPLTCSPSLPFCHFKNVI